MEIKPTSVLLYIYPDSNPRLYVNGKPVYIPPDMDIQSLHIVVKKGEDIRIMTDSSLWIFP